MTSLSQRQTRQFIIVAAGVVVLGLLALFLVFGLGGGKSNLGPFSLTVWGTDPPLAWEGVIRAYRAARPNGTINYKKVDATNYRSTLLNALAAGRGPDVFYISNRGLLEDIDKVVPVSPAQFHLLRLRELFPAAVENDFVYGEEIFALPPYMDTMVMIYNRDLFDQAGIAVPPKTWDEFLRIVPRLRGIGSAGEIKKAAAAIGGSELSIDAGVDLLTLLMLQNGAKMTNDAKTGVVFASGPSGAAGYRAFDFYLQFANPASPYYTWSDKQPNSLSAFAQGKVAAVFNYLSSIAAVRSESPFLDIAIAPMPQPSGAEAAVSYARYHGLAVSRQSRASAWAWDFIIFVTTNPVAAKAYTEAVGKLPAARTLIAGKVDDLNLGVFARQALTARSWLMPSDAGVRDIFNRAIRSVLTNQSNSTKALKQAEGQINQLYPKK